MFAGAPQGRRIVWRPTISNSDLFPFLYNPLPGAERLDPFEEFAQKLVEVLLTFTPRPEELPKPWEIFQTNPHAVHAKRLSKLLRSLPQLVPHRLKQGPKHGLKGSILIAVILGIAQPDSRLAI